MHVSPRKLFSQLDHEVVKLGPKWAQKFKGDRAVVVTAKFSVKFWQGLLFNVVHFLGGWLFIIVFVRKRCRPFSTSRDIAFASPGAFFFSFPFF